MLAGGAALILAGCAVAAPPGTRPSATGTAGRAPASPAPSASLTPGQRAQADAAAILAAFAMPPGAKRLPAPPANVRAALGQPFQKESSPDFVDKDSFWTVPSAPAAALAWEEQHVPRRFTHAETFHGTDGKVAQSGDVFTLPPIAGVLESRELMVEVADGGGGQTAIRVDAQVTWTPAKPAGAVVPAAARVVTLSMNYGGNADGRKPPEPVTITDPVTVGKVAALVDHVPPLPSGTYNCPFADGMAFDLAFRARPGGPVLAAAVCSSMAASGWTSPSASRTTALATRRAPARSPPRCSRSPGSPGNSRPSSGRTSGRDSDVARQRRGYPRRTQGCRCR